MTVKYKIFGYAPRQNSAYDWVLETMKLDSSACGDQLLVKERVKAVFNHCDSLMKDEEMEAFGALAIIGLTELLVAKEFALSEYYTQVFLNAVSLDPMKDYAERIQYIGSLKKQVSSIIEDNLNVQYISTTL